MGMMAAPRFKAGEGILPPLPSESLPARAAESQRKSPRQAAWAHWRLLHGTQAAASPPAGAEAARRQSELGPVWGDQAIERLVTAGVLRRVRCRVRGDEVTGRGGRGAAALQRTGRQ